MQLNEHSFNQRTRKNINVKEMRGFHEEHLNTFTSSFNSFGIIT